MNFLSQRSNITRTQMQSRLWNSYYVVTIILLTFNGMVMALFNNTITLHTESLGLGTTVSGMLVSLGTAVTLFYRFFSAMLTDRIGRQKITCIGLIVILRLIQPMEKSTVYPR